MIFAFLVNTTNKLLGTNPICHTSHIKIIQPEIESVQPLLETFPYKKKLIFACNLLHLNYVLKSETALCQAVIYFFLRDLITISLLLGVSNCQASNQTLQMEKSSWP